MEETCVSCGSLLSDSQSDWCAEFAEEPTCSACLAMLAGSDDLFDELEICVEDGGECVNCGACDSY